MGVCVFKRIASRCVIKISPIEREKYPNLATPPERPSKLAQSGNTAERPHARQSKSMKTAENEAGMKLKLI